MLQCFMHFFTIYCKQEKKWGGLVKLYWSIFRDCWSATEVKNRGNHNLRGKKGPEAEKGWANTRGRMTRFLDKSQCRPRQQNDPHAKCRRGRNRQVVRRRLTHLAGTRVGRGEGELLGPGRGAQQWVGHTLVMLGMKLTDWCNPTSCPCFGPSNSRVYIRSTFSTWTGTGSGVPGSPLPSISALCSCLCLF